MDFAKSIKPKKNDGSDKFLNRLYKRALRRGREQVFISTLDIWGEKVTPDLAALKKGSSTQQRLLMIGSMGSDGWFSGNNLREATRDGATTESFAYGPAHDTKNWLEITDCFWKTYLEIGRCLVWSNSGHRWRTINANSRKCVHCGIHQRRTVKTVRKITREEIWS